MYAGDYEDRLPVIFEYSTDNVNLSNLLAPYLHIKNRSKPKVLVCPALDYNKIKTGSWKESVDTYWDTNSDASLHFYYRPNQANGFHRPPGTSAWCYFRKVSKLKYPTSYVTVGESNAEAGGSYRKQWFNWANDATQKFLGLRNHNQNTSVFLHADGHADVISIPEPLRGTSGGGVYRRYFYPNGKEFEMGVSE